MSEIYATQAPLYRAAGYWPRPIELGSKACRIKGWQRPNTEIDDAELDDWEARYGQQGIGLLMGSPFSDGTTLGAFDIDSDQYVELAKALFGGYPPCGRIGSKGAAFFVRVQPGVKNSKFRVGSKDGPLIAEALFSKSLLVIPPTIHPDTDQPYRWLGKPLLDVHFSTLPLIGA